DKGQTICQRVVRTRSRGKDFSGENLLSTQRLSMKKLDSGRNSTCGGGLGLLGFEEEYTERRQAEVERIRTSQPGHRLGLDATVIPHVAAAVYGCIGVEHFAVKARFGDAYAVGLADDRCEVGHHDKDVLGVLRAAEEGKHARIGVIAIDPLKPVPIEIHLME